LQEIKARAKELWDKEWRNTKRAGLLRQISKRGGATGYKFYKGFSNRQACTELAQLRTEHCRLNAYLHRIGKRESAECECGYEKETVEHFILECPNYKEQRKELRKKAGARRMRADKLLGNSRLAKHTLEYIKATSRMELED
jgi:hypothetical protein